MTTFNKLTSYVSPADFVYNTALIEVTANVARLKDRKQANSTFYAGFHIPSVLDADYGNGILTGTPVGSPAIVGAKLDLTGGGKALIFDAALNAAFQQLGCVRFKYTPNYTGAPLADTSLFTISKALGETINVIEVRHLADENLFVEIKDQAGAAIVADMLGVYHVAFGIECEYELDIDITTGATRLFVNGVQFGATMTGTGVRSSDINMLAIGSSWDGGMYPNGFMSEFIVFNTVQHTTDFVSEIPRLNQCQYTDSSPSIIDAVAVSTRGLLNFSVIKTLAANTSLKYVLNVNSVDKYWSGSAWATSTGVSQSNTEAEILANILTLDLSAGASLKVKTYLISTYGNTRPSVTSYTYDYTFSGGVPIVVSKCIVFGWLRDVNGVAQAGFNVSAKLDSYSKYNAGLVVGSSDKQTVTDATGYWELLLTNTALMLPVTTYTFSFSGGLSLVQESKAVPNSASVNYATL